MFAVPRVDHGEERIPIHGRKAIVNTSASSQLDPGPSLRLQRPG